jgi:putative membrane-bound dehydrogenase-like protein
MSLALLLAALSSQDLGVPPLEAAKRMSLPPGFKATAFAHEPDVRQPNAMCIDDRGRLWVAENFSYTGPGGPWKPSGKDTILVFEDKDGDGRFDTRKVFIDSLSFISGLEVGFGGVWVGSPPALLFIPDKDGDDRPDGPPQVVLDGWGYQDQHETLNSFIWGPDGWLYGCHGVFTHSRVGKPGSPDAERVPLNAAYWRYHPTRGAFEVFATGTSNSWGFDYDDTGNWFSEACVIPHLWHIVQGGRYQRQGGRHFNPHTFDDLKTIADHRHENLKGRKGGHAHGGARFVLHDLWGAEWRGKFLVGTIHHHGIYTEAFERKGSGFVGKHVDDFMMANDPIYLGFNHDFGPDGSLYVIDWYDPKSCHGQTPEHVATGRIFRIAHDSTKRVEVDLAKRSSEELVALQLDRNEWFVRHARRVLQERGPDPKVHALLRAILNENPDVGRKLRALWALQVTGGATDELLAGLLKHGSEHLRAWSIQLLAEDGTIPDAVRGAWALMAKEDPSPALRLALASALQRIPVEQRWETLEGLVSHAEDAADHNLPLMVWYAVEPCVAADRTRALRLAAASRIPRVREFVTRRISVGGGPIPPPRPVGADGLALHLKASGFGAEGWAEAVEPGRRFAPPQGAGRPKAAEVEGRPAVRFDGSDDALSVAGDTALMFGAGDAFTLAVWVHVEKAGKGGWRGIVTKSRDQEPWYGLWIEPGGAWYFGGAASIKGPAALPGWRHLCAVQDAGGRKLYVDGKQVSAGNRADANGAGALWLGGAASVDEFFAGSIGELRLYRRALDEAEIAAQARAP